MYNHLIRMLFKNTNKTALGRWERTNRAQNKIKIDLANTDHCGGSKEGRRSLPSLPATTQNIAKGDILGGTCHYVPKPKDMELHELTPKQIKTIKLLK